MNRWPNPSNPVVAVAVLLIHRIAGECLIESAGSTQHLLLRSGPEKEAATGLDTVGEIQGKRSQTAREEAS